MLGNARHFLNVHASIDVLPIRVDYNSSAHSINITMASPMHESTAEVIRLVFEPCMQHLQSQYSGSWRYTTNCLFPIYQRCGNHVIPSTTNLTPDGTISEESGLCFIVKISTSQMCQAVDRKLKIFFNNPSVVTVIIVNIDKTLSYASPGETNNWDSGEFMHWSRLLWILGFPSLLYYICLSYVLQSPLVT